MFLLNLFVTCTSKCVYLCNICNVRCPIAVASSRNQNLGSIQIFGSFVPANRAYPYGGFEAQATANGSYQSYFATVFGGLDF